MNKKLSLTLLSGAMLLSAGSIFAKDPVKKPRVGLAGLSIECSTFSPAQTTEEFFRINKEDKVFDLYSFLAPDSTLRQQADWFPAMVSAATPGGIVTRECYESLVGQTLDLLKQNAPYDALYLDLHGAMSVVGMDDPEGDFLKRVRSVVGGKTIISSSMDLHGCVSPRLAEECDLITCFRMAPHEDRWFTKRRAVANMMDRLETGKGKPKYKAWVYVPILLPGEKTSTRIDPGKTLYAKVDPATKHPGVIDAAIWISYAWADEPRNHGVVMAYGDDKKAVAAAAESLAKSFWDVRDEFEFVAPTSDLNTCLEAAFKSTKKPYFLSDMGDNPTAGGAGDVSWTLEQLLKREELKSENGPTFIYAAIPGPEMVAKAMAAGVGSTVSGKVGAMVDNRYAGPVDLTGVVESVFQNEGNNQVVIRTGSLRVVVAEKRTPFHYERNFLNVGLNPREADIVMVKLGYLTEELYDMQADWMMALTRGGVDQDLLSLPYKRIPRPMYPLDPDMKTPKFKAVFIPVSR